MALALLALLASLAGGCSVIKAATAAPLPPAETIGLSAQVLPGDTSMGNKTVRISWTPPGAGVEKVAIEQADSRGGPWQEVKLVDAKRGFHDETSLFRPGHFYYFRGTLLRGNEESPPGPAVELWVPRESPVPTPTPRPSPTPVPPAATPTPAA